MERIWIFGGFERGCNRLFVVPVPDCTRRPLVGEIKQGNADDTNTLTLQSHRKCSVKGGWGWGGVGAGWQGCGGLGWMLWWGCGGGG